MPNYPSRKYPRRVTQLGPVSGPLGPGPYLDDRVARYSRTLQYPLPGGRRKVACVQVLFPYRKEEVASPLAYKRSERSECVERNEDKEQREESGTKSILAS